MKKTICLNMIVKNESGIIRRCLDSVCQWLDYWVIIDTGSTDGTQEIIREHLRDIPGELYERPWKNFGFNRNEAMELAQGKGDYLLFIDADDRIVIPEGYTLPPLEADMYSILQREGIGTTFREHHVYFLVRNNTDLGWRGVVHEYLTCSTDKSRALLEGIFCHYINDGNRSKDPEKCHKDIELLKSAYQEDPSDSRSAFYLARTYWSIREYQSASEWFRVRAVMGGDPIEVYCSLLYIGLAGRDQKEDPEKFLASFARAYLYRPSRAEAIYEMGRYYVDAGNPLVGYAVLRMAASITPSDDNLFVEAWVNQWGIPTYLFQAALQIGRNEEARVLGQELLANPHFPQEIRKKFGVDEALRQLESV